MLKSGLYIVATPIGNLKDLSERAKEILTQADVIAAEDTRVTKKLFSLLGLSLNKSFLAYEDHLEQERLNDIIELIKEGNSVALVSDAGSPLISDPGYKLVRACRGEGLYVTTVPGACAVICALQLSGLPTNRFMFAGFIPNKDKARFDLFSELKDINTTLVLYETALRLEKSLKVINDIMPQREVAVVREISKLYEECLSGYAGELLSELKERTIKGEIVLMIAPPAQTEPQAFEWEELLREELQKSSVKEAVKKIAETYHLKRNDVYAKALEFKNKPL
ncbi:MAG: 16S rRNA (cytidine(1402)-2'-O)-methyltransferase [Alphaproteobacteria bacterium]|nr:16S rRNA (cytidine(1402)-2'-O)-methyltransferase [Alphaproteobacteria bacterium]